MGSNQGKTRMSKICDTLPFKKTKLKILTCDKSGSSVCVKDVVGRMCALIQVQSVVQVEMERKLYCDYSKIIYEKAKVRKFQFFYNYLRKS